MILNPAVRSFISPALNRHKTGKKPRITPLFRVLILSALP